MGVHHCPSVIGQYGQLRSFCGHVLDSVAHEALLLHGGLLQRCCDRNNLGSIMDLLKCFICLVAGDAGKCSMRLRESEGGARRFGYIRMAKRAIRIRCPREGVFLRVVGWVGGDIFFIGSSIVSRTDSV